MSTLTIAGQKINKGERKRIMLEMAPLYDFTPTGIPVEIVRGKKDGPVLFICAAIHGDEINGVQIIKRLLKHKRLKSIAGTLIAVPIVNVFGFNTKSRYLPDRRDLNRCFPGNKDGSLAAQMAHLLMQEVFSKSTHGIDLHTAAIHRNNLPQVRGCFEDPETRRLAEAFGVPVMINSDLRDGSLREAVQEKNIPILLYEGGEALRFDEKAARIGIKGILNVMEAIGMLPCPKDVCSLSDSFHAETSYWLRAPHSGILQVKVKLGKYVKQKQLLGTISDPFGTHSYEIRAKSSGIVIGMSMIPLFNKGDAVFHIATFEHPSVVEENMDQYQEDMLSEPDTFIT